jgi:hypothetical protein
MARAVSATIKDATGRAREGLRVEFHATEPATSVYAITDAGGVFVADLEPGAAYMVPVMNAVYVEGQAFPAGTIFRVVVPEGEGPVAIGDVTVDVIDWSLPAQWARMEAIETRLAMLEALP